MICSIYNDTTTMAITTTKVTCTCISNGKGGKNGRSKAIINKIFDIKSKYLYALLMPA